jgi:hypothetical protein
MASDLSPALLTRLRSWLSSDPALCECWMSVGEVREIVGALEAKGVALQSLLEACAAFRTAMGAPGDYGYETREGQALFALYRAVAQARAAGIEVIEVTK